MLLYVQSDVVLALSVDLPTVQMEWLVFSMNWALVSQFFLLSCLERPFIDTGELGGTLELNESHSWCFGMTYSISQM